jgi:hypothetical protein
VEAGPAGPAPLERPASPLAFNLLARPKGGGGASRSAKAKAARAGKPAAAPAAPPGPNAAERALRLQAEAELRRRAAEVGAAPPPYPSPNPPYTPGLPGAPKGRTLYGSLPWVCAALLGGAALALRCPAALRRALALGRVSAARSSASGSEGCPEGGRAAGAAALASCMRGGGVALAAGLGVLVAA